MQLINRWALSAPLLGAALLMATTAFADSHYDGSDESDARDIDVQLTGSQEVPSVSTDTTGRYWLEFDDDGANMTSRLDVYDGDEITAAHLHCARPGENGPAIVTLFSDSNGTDVDGQLDSGSINDSDIADVNCASEIGYDIEDRSDLARAIDDGDIYVNVHSQSHPNGLVRGNLPARDNDDDDGHDDDHGYGGNHDWKDDDSDGRNDWYKDHDGNWKDSCNEWSDDDRDGKHDWNGKDYDKWDDDRSGDKSWNDDTDDWKDDDDGNHDWKHSDNDDWDHKSSDGHDGKNGRDGKDGKDGNSYSRNEEKNSHFLRTGLRLGLRL